MAFKYPATKSGCSELKIYSADGKLVRQILREATTADGKTGIPWALAVDYTFMTPTKTRTVSLETCNYNKEVIDCKRWMTYINHVH